jgi:hypothetical protein
MDWRAAAFDLAGVIGIGVAVVHGVLVQRLMVGPIGSSGARMATAARRLTPGLLHFSTFNWLVGGLALIAAANGFPPGARVATAVLVGASYLYGALGNLWATRGRHPGWVLYAAAVALIVYGVS